MRGQFMFIYVYFIKINLNSCSYFGAKMELLQFKIKKKEKKIFFLNNEHSINLIQKIQIYKIKIMNKKINF